jgi:hypothetical protein
MNNLFQPKRYTKNMPPTPVTDDMRSQLKTIAQREGISLAQLQRTAFAVLLRLDTAMSLLKEETGSTVNISQEAHPNEKMRVYLELFNAHREEYTG